jgi:hypothetical protein
MTFRSGNHGKQESIRHNHMLPANPNVKRTANQCKSYPMKTCLQSLNISSCQLHPMLTDTKMYSTTKRTCNIQKLFLVSFPGFMSALPNSYLFPSIFSHRCAYTDGSKQDLFSLKLTSVVVGKFVDLEF